MYRNLQAEMARAGLTLSELARRVQITEQNLGYKIRGKITWKLKDMEKVQAVLNYELGQNYTLDYLFTPYEEEDQQ